MKKILLLVVASIMTCVAAFAEETSWTVSFAYGNGTSDSSTTYTTSNFLTTAILSGAENFAACTATDKCYAGKLASEGMKFSSSSVNGKFTVTLADAAKVKATKITVEAMQYSSDVCKLSINGSAAQTITGNSAHATYTFTLDGQTELSEITVSATKRLYMKSLTVWYEAGSVITPSVATPVISQEGNTVTIACETEGANIYYTLNGNEPTAESTAYTAPFELTAAATVKAIAIKDTESSFVATRACTYTATYATLADLIAKAKKDDVFTFSGNLTVLGQIGTNLYVQDAAGTAILVFQVSGTYNNGDIIAGLEGTYSPYNALPEITNATLGEVTSGEAVEPAVMTIPEITVDLANKYVRLENVDLTLDATNGRKATATDAAENTLALYSSSKDFEYPVEGKYNIIGFVNRYNDDVQFTPVTFEVVLETVATPVFSLEAGSYEVGQPLEITCATEGATIYYTLNGTEPTAESTEYNAAIVLTEDVTVKAIAIAEGMNDSEVVSATYVVTKTGIDEIGTDNNAPVEYFNLQGVRVNYPEAGQLYIIRQGSKVTKQIVK